MKQFEEVSIWVRRLDINLDVNITLPCDNVYSELDKAFGGESWREHDYEIVDVDDEHNIFHDFKMYGYVNIERMNEVAEQLSEIDNIELLLAINEAHSVDLKELLEDDLNDKYFLYEDTTAEDYVYSQVEDGYYGEIHESLIIDYSRMARDLTLSGDVNETSYGLLIG